MKQIHKQPLGFSTLFLTEMWERYGFYVVQTILIFILIEKLELNDSQAYGIVGSFTALAYINCLFGGIIADRFIGYNQTVIIGGLSLIIGYSFLGIANDLQLSLIGLAFVSVGTGFLKPNVSSMVGLLYKDRDDNKDIGYTLYYVGIYIGALSGSWFGGYFRIWFGSLWSFISAAIGVILSVIIFVYGTKKYQLYDHRHNQIMFAERFKALISFFILILIAFMILKYDFLSTWYFILVFLFCFSFIVYYIVISNGVDRSKLIAFSILLLLSIIYWAIFFQQFFSLSLCIDRVTRLSVPASIISSIESFGVICFGPLINLIWFKFKEKQKPIKIATKFSLGFLFNAFCFIILCLGLWYAKITHEYLSIVFIILAYLIISIGELCLSPSCLSMVTSLVPDKLTSAMMGISLLSIGFGGKFAGLLAINSSISKHMSLDLLESNYLKLFFDCFLISLVTYIVALILIKFVNRLMKV